MNIFPLAAQGLVIGVCATVVMDLWTVLLSRLFGVKPLDYAMVGRWLGHMPSGRFRFAHAGIGHATPISGETALGWLAHYTIGVGFATLLVALTGPAWRQAPTLAPALVFGIVTTAIPFFVMQPAFGLGIAAANTPKPAVARLRSLMTHAVFGLGLYVGARLVSLAIVTTG